MKNKKITILGGGPAGLSVGYYAKKNNIPFELFESSKKLGGNCSTFKTNEFYYDSGAHRLHDKDAKATKEIKNLLKEDLFLIKVPSQIYRDGQFIDFPLTPLNILSFLGPFRFFKAALQILKNKFNNKLENNFNDLAVKTYGLLLSQLFLLKYTEKLWGKPAKELSVKVAGSRLKGLNFKTFLLESLQQKDKKVAHLDGSFYYPKYGIGTIFQKMGKFCGEDAIFLDKRITKLVHENFQFKHLEYNHSEQIDVSSIVSSLPLGLFIKLLEPSPPTEILEIINSIKFRNLILIALFLDKDSVNNNGSMYFPSEKFPFTRIYEPKNRSSFMSPKGKTSLIVEIPCQSSDAIWSQEPDEVTENVKQQLIECNFFKPCEIIDSEVKKLYNAYPILEKDFEKKINPVFKYLKQFKNLTLTGRNGLFEYTHIHDHMKNARNIISQFNN